VVKPGFYPDTYFLLLFLSQSQVFETLKMHLENWCRLLLLIVRFLSLRGTKTISKHWLFDVEGL